MREDPVTDAMVKGRQGFASMNADLQRQIARKGGQTAHRNGTAHHWTTEEARAAGRKGGREASHRRRLASAAALKSIGSSPQSMAASSTMCDSRSE
jgi:uncharacterized protein